MSELKPCPICHVSPEIEYACGDYFAFCSDNCPSPMCDHASESATALSWNDWANWYDRRYQEPNEPLTLEQLREMDGEPVWIQGDSAKVSGWTLFKSSTEKQIARCPDEWNISYYLKDYGKTWLAYRRKTESEESR